jgi:hypothetical protein
MKISRQVGTTNEILSVFIQDGTVSTGAGLANIVASSVSFGILRSNQATVSSGSCSSGGTLGTYGVSTLTQMSSTLMLGWYQFCPPDYAFASGTSVALHLYGAPNMVALPMEIELTKFNNQAYVSTYDIRSVANPVGVSTNTDKGNYGVSSIVTVGVSSLAANVLTSTAISTAAFAAGKFATDSLVGKGDWAVSSGVNVTTNSDKTGYSASAGVTSLAANVLTSTAISTAAFAAAKFATDSLVGKGNWAVSSGVHVTSYGALAGVSTVTDKGGYGVTSLATDTITAASVSSAALNGKGDWNIGKTGYALTAVYDPAKTASQAGDAMTLTAAYGVAGAISTNIAFVRGVAVATGTGTSSDPWGP